MNTGRSSCNSCAGRVRLGNNRLQLGRKGLTTSPFIFEGEMLQALADGEVQAAAVTPASVGYWNQTHPEQPFELVPAYLREPDLRWQLAVGVRRPDQPLREAIDRAVTEMLEDGTVARVYAGYGIAHDPPERQRTEGPAATQAR